jgi:hypothetical protein
MRGKYAFRSRNTVGPRKRQPMQDIQFDRKNKRFIIRAINETHTDIFLSTKLRSFNSMHPVNNTGTAPLNQNSGKPDRSSRVR